MIAYGFQFHKGAIRTKYKKGVGYVGNQFQFHKGAIRTNVMKYEKSYSSYFNSIKVRLER